MSETSISSISNVRPAEASAQAPVPAQSDSMGSPRLAALAAQARPVAPVQKAEVLTQAGPKLAGVAEKATLPVSNGSNVSIHFRVDEKTNDLTVFVVDRKSKKVIRSIPANELSKLSVGELLKISA